MSFDPNTFLNQTFDEANDTKIIPCPVGEYLAIADKVEIKPWAAKDGSSSGLKVEIVWDIQDEAAKKLTGKSKVLVRQQQMLDTTEEGGLDFGAGKNVGLGRIREALGLNKAGKPFSFNMLEGQMATVKVSHRPYEGEMYDEVKAISKAG
jgi:hypothetical protein